MRRTIEDFVRADYSKADSARHRFTGSIAVGKMLGKTGGPGHESVYTAELGGHAPVIVCADVDIEAVAKLSVNRKFRNAGRSARRQSFLDP